MEERIKNNQDSSHDQRDASSQGTDANAADPDEQFKEDESRCEDDQADFYQLFAFIDLFFFLDKYSPEQHG